jgi:hypothetical protein
VLVFTPFQHQPKRLAQQLMCAEGWVEAEREAQHVHQRSKVYVRTCIAFTLMKEQNKLIIRELKDEYAHPLPSNQTLCST